MRAEKTKGKAHYITYEVPLLRVLEGIFVVEEEMTSKSLIFFHHFTIYHFQTNSFKCSRKERERKEN